MTVARPQRQRPPRVAGALVFALRQLSALLSELGRAAAALGDVELSARCIYHDTVCTVSLRSKMPCRMSACDGAFLAEMCEL